jgi:hypothetical protein
MTAEPSQSPVHFIILGREKTKIRTECFSGSLTTRAGRIVAGSFSLRYVRDSVNYNNFSTWVSSESIVLLTGRRGLCERESVALVAVSISKDSAS